MGVVERALISTRVAEFMNRCENYFKYQISINITM